MLGTQERGGTAKAGRPFLFELLKNALTARHATAPHCSWWACANPLQ
jgi:hypothetical protein